MPIVASWDIQLLEYRLIWGPIGYLPTGRLIRRSELNQEIFMESCLVFLIGLWDIHCSGYLDLDSLGVLFLSLSIGILIERLGSQSGYLEFGRDLDGDIVRATRSSIGRP